MTFVCWFFMLQEQLLHQDVPLYEVRMSADEVDALCLSMAFLKPVMSVWPILFPSLYVAVKEATQDE